MIDLAAQYGLSGKFTGSGGAIVCIRNAKGNVLNINSGRVNDTTGTSNNSKDYVGKWYQADEELIIKTEFNKQGYEFERIIY